MTECIALAAGVALLSSAFSGDDFRTASSDVGGELASLVATSFSPVGNSLLLLGLGALLFLASGRVLLSVRRRRSGEPSVGSAVDVSEIVSLQQASDRRRREMAQATLAELGDALTSSLEPQTLFEGCATVLARNLCDVCLVNIVQEGGVGVQHAAVAVRDPERLPVAERLRGQAFIPRRPFLGDEALRERSPVLCSETSPAGTLASCASPAHLAALEALGVRSWISLPLLVDGEVLGTVWLLRSAMPGFVSDDLHVAAAVARTIAHALENARLYGAARNATAARDRLLSVVAHDLRNPLNAILLRTQTLARDAGRSDERLGEALEGILRSARQMNRLIADLLCAEQLENGSLSLQRQCIRPQVLIDQALAEFSPLVSGRRMEVDVEPGLAPVSADPTRILQVFSNLLGNAVKFTPEKAPLRLSVRRDGCEARFEVADAGPGLPRDHRAFLFEPFRQGRKDPRGLGLGMWICRQIIESHGGRIWVDRSSRSGTTFCFSVPFAEVAPLELRVG